MSTAAPVNGCSNSSRRAWRNWRLEPEIARGTVDRIAAHGQADRLEVNTDLVCPPRFESDVEQRVMPHRLADVEPRHRVSRRRRVE